MKKHVVKQGQDMFSIAYQYGISSWEDLYNHSLNKRLKEIRSDPSCLYPGDIVYIPDLEPIKYVLSTDQIHQLKIKIPKAKLNLRFLDAQGNPIANKPYQLVAAGEVFIGNTTGDGVIEQEFSMKAKRAQISVWDDDPNGEPICYDLDVGHLDPIDEVSGMQARLNSLGIDSGNTDDDLGPMTLQAVKDFQKDAGMEETGVVDENFLGELKKKF